MNYKIEPVRPSATFSIQTYSMKGNNVMATNKVSKLGEFVDTNKFKPELASAEDFVNVPMVVKEYEFRQGRFGEFIILKCQVPSQSNLVSVSTGAKGVVNLIRDLEQIEGFSVPFQATIRKQGSAYYLE